MYGKRWQNFLGFSQRLCEIQLYGVSWHNNIVIMNKTLHSVNISLSSELMTLSNSWLCKSFSGEEFDVKAKCVINATGPYTDNIRLMDNAEERKICQPSQGVHIVLPDYYRYYTDHQRNTELLIFKDEKWTQIFLYWN